MRKAFLHNHLIFAFKETAHNKDYVAKEHMYPAEEVSAMLAVVKAAAADVKTLKKYLHRQKKAALSETIRAYQEGL